MLGKNDCYLANFLLAIVFALAPSSLPAQTAKESKSESIGPWEIEATFKGDKFDRCSISRKLDDDISVMFTRTDDSMTMTLDSPNWRLDRGEKYPVKMRLGPQSWDMDVAAESNSVSIDVTDDKFASGLRTASALNVVAAGATIRVPLDKSAEALGRLETCVEKNSRAVQTNPFVAPARQP